MKGNFQRGIGWLRNDLDAMATALAKFVWRKRFSITNNPENCKRYFRVEFRKLVKRVFDI
jgi:hypothetical protein